MTNGPVVNESLETSVPGVFAAGNVLHVHDLVDYVSEEAALAGKSAAAYIREYDQGSIAVEMARIPVTVSGGIRYSVPVSVAPGRISDWLKVRFRVGDVMRNKKVVLYLDGVKELSKRRHVMAPGEMEEVVLTRKVLDRHPDLKSIEIKVEEG